MERITAEMIRLNKLKTFPNFFSIPGGLHQMVITSDTRNILLSEFIKDKRSE
jgi:hypothetical protein